MRLTGQTVDASGRGVADATVWIDSQTVTSDRDGRFALEDLIGRSYNVRAQVGDLIGGPQVMRVTPHSEPMVIELREGPHVMVTVVDMTRAPIANASVRVIGSASVTSTDAAGTTRLTTHPGNLAIEATSEGFAPGEGSAVACSGTCRVTIVLRAGFVVSGRVFDEARTPIANARIHRKFTNEARVAAVSDADGAFVIPSAVGIQSLLVIDDEHAPTRSARFDVDRPITELEIVMKPGAVYAGHVVDADARPVAAARVYLDTVLADGPHHYGTSSDANGEFEIRGLPRTIGSSNGGAVIAHAVSDGSATDDILVTFVEQRELRELRGQLLTLERIETTGVIAGVVVDDLGAPVPNVVVNAAPRPRLPLPDAIIRSRVRPYEADPTKATSTRANAAGEFSIRDLPAGDYGVWPGPFSQFPFSGLATRFFCGEDVSPFIASVTTGDTAMHLVMPRSGRIAGKVAFTDTGELVDGFEVDVFGAHELATGLSGEHGAFDLHGLRPGSYRLQIRGPVFAKVWKTGIEVDAGQHVDVGTITIDRGQTLSGMVVDATGRGIGGASVTLGESGFYGDVGRLEPYTLGPPPAVTDAAGAFAIVGGAPNRSLSPSWRVLVRADHPSYGQSLPVAIPAGKQEPAPVTLTLLECGSITGKLTRNGLSLGGASVNAGWPTFATAAVNADGEFAMSRLPAGPVSLRIQVYADQIEGRHQTTVEVEAGTQTAVTLEVPAGTIKLSVIMTRTAEVAGAWVYLFSGTVEFQNYAELWAQFLAPAMQGRTFWRGDETQAAFERLVPGDYTVCTVPLEGDPHDQGIMQRVHGDRASVNVHCIPVRVVAAPDEQTVSV